MMGEGNGVMSTIEFKAGDDRVDGGVSDPTECVDAERIDFLLGRRMGKVEAELECSDDDFDLGESR